MMKRSRFFSSVLALIALFAIVFSLASCGKNGEYPEIPSSKTESTPVATLGGHEVKYELFRAFFSAMYSGRTDGMSEEGWNAAVKEVMTEIAFLYATLDVAEENGVDPYGDAVNEGVAERVKIDYEGGEVNGEIVEGLGTRDNYEAALKAANLTDAVNRLIYRYDVTQAELWDYVINNYSYGKDPGEIGDPRAFFDSDACAHGVWVFVTDDFQGGQRADALAYAESKRAELASASDYSQVRQILIETWSYQALSSDEVENGFYVSKHQGSTRLERDLIADFFSLSPYSCGEIREGETGVWFAVGLPKDPADYERDPNAIYDLMIEETRIDRPIAEKAAAYLAGVSYSTAFPSFSAETLAELTLQ